MIDLEALRRESERVNEIDARRLWDAENAVQRLKMRVRRRIARELQQESQRKWRRKQAENAGPKVKA